MIASNFSTSDLPLVVIVSDAPACFAELQRRMAARFSFFVCHDERIATRIASDELVSGWLVDATAPDAAEITNRLAATRMGHRMALVDREYCEQSERNAYHNGAYYVCGELVLEWLESFLGIDSFCTAAADAVSVQEQQAEMAVPGGP